MTVAGTLRKNNSEIPTLILSVKHRNVHSSIYGFTSDQTLVSYVPARNKSVILILSHHYDDTHTGGEITTNLKTSCTIMPLKVELTSTSS